MYVHMHVKNQAWMINYLTTTTSRPPPKKTTTKKQKTFCIAQLCEVCGSTTEELYQQWTVLAEEGNSQELIWYVSMLPSDLFQYCRSFFYKALENTWLI